MKLTNGDEILSAYAPKAGNIILSRLMNAGKLLFVRVTSKEMLDNWLKIEIKVFLHK